MSSNIIQGKMWAELLSYMAGPPSEPLSLEQKGEDSTGIGSEGWNLYPWLPRWWWRWVIVSLVSGRRLWIKNHPTTAINFNQSRQCDVAECGSRLFHRHDRLSFLLIGSLARGHHVEPDDHLVISNLCAIYRYSHWSLISWDIREKKDLTNGFHNRIHSQVRDGFIFACLQTVSSQWPKKWRSFGPLARFLNVQVSSKIL